MNQATDRELIEAWVDQPAPLLPMLHAFHDRDGYLSDDALRLIGKALRIPIADLFGTVTFYHHFSRTPHGRECKRVCTGPVCRRRGALELLDELRPQNATEMPCSGRCDQPVPVLQGETTLIGRMASDLVHRPSPLPVANPGGHEECVFRHIRTADRASYDGYCATEGYQGLRRILAEGQPQDVVDLISASGLAGRGGAGFPTGRKWAAVAQAEGQPKAVICNADEGEPGCFKDRAIMDYDPHALLEGMILAAFATGSELGFIYLRYEYPETAQILQKAIDEANAAGLLGRNIAGRDGFNFQIYLRRGAGAYICGEEGSLINSLEGKHPFPRNRPPFPVTHGFNDKPTAVNNVETLASAAHIVNLGAEWYQGLGMGEFAGTKIISLSGDVARPGNYEVPFGLPLQTLLNDWAGGPLPGRSFQAVTMAGLSGGFLAADALNVTLDEPAIRAHGSFLGAGGIMVFDNSRDMMKVAAEAMHFFAHESCGKCFPCRIGTQRLSERLSLEAGPRDHGSWVAEVSDISTVMQKLSACGLGIAAPLIPQSLMKYFPDLVAARVALPGQV